MLDGRSLPVLLWRLYEERYPGRTVALDNRDARLVAKGCQVGDPPDQVTSTDLRYGISSAQQYKHPFVWWLDEDCVHECIRDDPAQWR
jgi:hypothetical protein